jgi:hypothetical protein
MPERTHENLLPEDKQNKDTPRRGPAGDSRPNENDPDPRTGGSLPQEDVEDRPGVSKVSPEDYPADQRAKG